MVQASFSALRVRIGGTGDGPPGVAKKIARWRYNDPCSKRFYALEGCVAEVPEAAPHRTKENRQRAIERPVAQALLRSQGVRSADTGGRHPGVAKRTEAQDRRYMSFARETAKRGPSVFAPLGEGGVLPTLPYTDRRFSALIAAPLRH